MFSVITCVIQFLANFIKLDLNTFLAKIAERLAYLPLGGYHPGLYEVLNHEGRLELCDDEGHQVVYTKRQEVKFLQDNIIAYQDQAWGDGDIFADYTCTPGIPVDRYREGNRYRVLISLRETKKHNDIEQFHIQRTITDGFANTTEDFQTDIDHLTRHLTLQVVFPITRPPQHVYLIERHAKRSQELGVDQIHTLADGRVEVSWQTTTPKLYETYILRWEW
ncbi:MAG: hypothetical protein K8I82_01685 [Anaerolineae bacterium]|nr:hypothetical protein [Anaerolineae bacterium]